MSFDDAAPKLQPFGIRELYDSETAILHISKPQYESTIKSYPDAVLSYLDDDDGEVITVGSGLELQQRLDEPVRPYRRGTSEYQTSTSRRGSMDDNMIHLFDIQRTQDNLAIWREHEAYSSKTLRTIRSNSVISDLAADERSSPSNSDTLEAIPPSPEPQSTRLSEQPISPTLAEQEQSFEVPTSPSINPTNPNARSAPSSNFMQDLDNVLSAACEGLEAFGLADFLDGTAKALQSMAQRTRDADTSPVEGLLEGFKDVVTEFGRFGLDILENLDNDVSASTREQEPQTAPATKPATSTPPRNQDAKKEKQDEKQARREARVAVKEQRREEKRARRVERLAHREERRSNKKGKAGDATESEHHEDLYHDAHPGPPEQPSILTPQEPRKRVSFADLQKDIAHQYQAAKSASVPWSQMVEHLAGAPLPLTPFVRQYRSFPNRPGPPPFAPAQSTKFSTGNTSIMDLETSNPDFTARYPPLMSFRRAKSVSELHKKASPATADNSATTTKSALTRYPSIGQLEAQRRTGAESGKTQVIAMQADMIRRRERQKAESSSHNHRAPSVEEDSDDMLSGKGRLPLHGVEGVASSIAKPLPGSWPEPRQDEPTRTESSGAFFNRMAGYGNPPAPRPVSPALSCRTTSPPEDPYFPPTGLRRAQTVSHSNPAARLSQPFDPLSNAPRLEQARSMHPTGPLPQRSLTVQHLRRPAPGPPSSVSNGPTTLWTNFPRSAQIPMLQPHPSAVCSTQPQYPRPPWPNNSNSSATTNPQNYFPRPMRSEPNFHRPAAPPAWGNQNGFAAAHPSADTKVDECVRTLRAMGYGANNPNEAARLDVYAGAAAGEIHEAIDMIEEDRAMQNDGKVNIRVL